ncbi:MAG TPA: response regulator transcription factor [Acidimicrobiia bacterium]|jgi:two-component system KDP operon response regulator KdpE
MTVVLLIEDDKLLRRALRASVRAWGFDVVEAGSGEEALTIVSDRRLDLAVLDLGLPGIDGLETLRHLRSFSDVPVIVLTVRDGLSDKLAAFAAGADDYVVKPFEPEELLARARAHLRRASATAGHDAVIHTDGLTIDLARRQVSYQGVPVRLTPTELRLLEVLLAERGKLVTRERLVESVFGSDRSTDQAKLRVHMLHLRKKLHDDAARPRLIFTEPGLGYRWVGETDDSGTLGG